MTKIVVCQPLGEMTPGRRDSKASGRASGKQQDMLGAARGYRAGHDVACVRVGMPVEDRRAARS